MRVEHIGRATLYLGKCEDVLPELMGEFDLLTDPPYGIKEHGGKKRFGPASAAKGFSSHKEYENLGWDNEAPPAELLAAMLQRTQDQIIWGANHFMSRIAADASQWLVWHKKGSDKSDFADCELAWTNLAGAVRYFRHDWVGFGAINSGVVREHPTQKPVPLMKWCMGFLSSGRTVLDPFMGSGSIGIAAAQTGRDYVGIEKHPAYFDIACRRIEDAQRQGDLFLSGASC